MQASSDRELLELAAKAIGCELHFATAPDLTPEPWLREGQRDWYWNPLVNDADAFRLALQLRIRFWSEGGTEAERGQRWIVAENMGGPESFVDVVNGLEGVAARRAIVRAAAQIGAKA